MATGTVVARMEASAASRAGTNFGLMTVCRPKGRRELQEWVFWGKHIGVPSEVTATFEILRVEDIANKKNMYEYMCRTLQFN